ncbi:AAA family ATPase [Kitasatospora sp. NPDC057015]|uniref:AAA family ATPase n=1 Tax=Kitasatospora sp. NPDC057015 TaxID=3346001 RepID=UPI0036433D77
MRGTRKAGAARVRTSAHEESDEPGRTDAPEEAAGATAGRDARPPDRHPGYQHGLIDLRGRPGRAPAAHYPPDAVVVISGLPGSGKSTLLRRWSTEAPVIDPRDVHLACEAVMPARIPYAAYRPWARVLLFLRLTGALRRGGPLLVHDCGSRPWLRRWLAAGAARYGRELHLVLLDLSPAEALAGQRARGRWASPRVFARHRRGLERLLRSLPADDGSRPAPGPVPPALAEATSVLLLDRSSREHASADFGRPGGGARESTEA